jgi:hypothetical protein
VGPTEARATAQVLTAVPAAPVRAPPSALPAAASPAPPPAMHAEQALLRLAILPAPSADERAALRAELAAEPTRYPDPDAEVARVFEHLAFQAAYAHWREHTMQPPASADERERLAELAEVLLATLDQRLARRELSAAEAAAARRMLQASPGR